MTRHAALVLVYYNHLNTIRNIRYKQNKTVSSTLSFREHFFFFLTVLSWFDIQHLCETTENNVLLKINNQKSDQSLEFFFFLFARKGLIFLLMMNVSRLGFQTEYKAKLSFISLPIDPQTAPLPLLGECTLYSSTPVFTPVRVC